MAHRECPVISVARLFEKTPQPIHFLPSKHGIVVYSLGKLTYVLYIYLVRMSVPVMIILYNNNLEVNFKLWLLALGIKMYIESFFIIRFTATHSLTRTACSNGNMYRLYILLW